MVAPEQIRDRILSRFPGAEVTVVANPGPAAQHSLLLPPAVARDIAVFLRDAPELRLDYCSNVTGIDWPAKPAPAGSAAAEAADSGRAATNPTPAGGAGSSYLEVVYHLYSMELKHGPVILRLRTVNRTDQVTLPSLTPVWRSCDFQEREVFDLYGVVFEGHPNLRRILMWDEFQDHPMRKDYVAPDDFEWEPTPHDQVLARAKQHYPPAEPTVALTPKTGGAA